MVLDLVIIWLAILARKEVYRHASVLRHTLNHQQRKEPSSADEVLP